MVTGKSIDWDGTEKERSREIGELYPRGYASCNSRAVCYPKGATYVCTREEGHSGIHVGHVGDGRACGYWVRGE